MRAKYVALMRGVNVGGRNKLAMKELMARFVEAGCENVTTYIQSGNVLFDLPATHDESPERRNELAGSISEQISIKHGYRLPIVIRSAAQLKAVLGNSPFLDRGEPIERLCVMFLADYPDESRVAKLDAARFLPDEFEVRGAEIFLNLPTGAGNTKLTNAYFDSALATISTSRNWRTVTKLVELLGE